MRVLALGLSGQERTVSVESSLCQAFTASTISESFLTPNSALRSALKLLGYNDVYHGYSVFVENPRDSQMWYAALQAKYDGVGKPFGREEFDRLLGHCQVRS